MKIFTMTCGKEVLLDDEGYERLPKSGWYLRRKELHNSNTDYAVHDDYGLLHRWVLGLDKTNDKSVVDHINHNGLDNRKSNLRIVTTSQNKRNITTHLKLGPVPYCGVTFERGKGGRKNRFRAKWNEGLPQRCEDGKRWAKQATKSFSFEDNIESCRKALCAAILYRNQKCRENEYILDERSTTIEKEILNNPNCEIEKILGADIQNLLSRVDPNGSK